MRIHELKIVKPKPEDTLGITRDKMPQVNEKDYPEFFGYLQDAGATLKKETVNPKTLKAIQGEFSDFGMVNAINKGKLKKPIIASSDNYIIDGHHRWLASTNIKQDVNIIRVSLPMKQLLKLTNDFPLTTYKSMYEYGKKKKSKAQTPNTLFNLGIT
jgi:hypothetical protein|tara:strand:- start:274 stop:744 length:471 start_codon:yes stop_codon:yes gene_type:complete